MSMGKHVVREQEFRQLQLQLEWKNNVKSAKITMSAAGKNQNINNTRWLKVIKRYRDYLIRHH
jgi:hypothetical protein